MQTYPGGFDGRVVISVSEGFAVEFVETCLTQKLSQHDTVRLYHEQTAAIYWLILIIRTNNPTIPRPMHKKCSFS